MFHLKRQEWFWLGHNMVKKHLELLWIYLEIHIWSVQEMITKSFLILNMMVLKDFYLNLVNWILICNKKVVLTIVVQLHKPVCSSMNKKFVKQKHKRNHLNLYVTLKLNSIISIQQISKTLFNLFRLSIVSMTYVLK